MLRIDGKDYELRYPINVLCSMCDAGIDVTDLASIKINIKVVRDLFMFGLRYENKKMTQAQAGDLIDAFIEEGGTFDELVNEIMTALNKSLGGSDGDEKDEGEEGK